MKDADFRKALETAKGEMSALLKERAALDQRIGQLKATIDTLDTLLGESTPSVSNAEWEVAAGVMNEYGISDAIRNLLDQSRNPMTPVQIKAALIASGFSPENYASIMAVIHNTLKRLERQGELVAIRDPSGKVFAYTRQWRTGG